MVGDVAKHWATGTKNHVAKMPRRSPNLLLVFDAGYCAFLSGDLSLRSPPLNETTRHTTTSRYRRYRHRRNPFPAILQPISLENIASNYEAFIQSLPPTTSPLPSFHLTYPIRAQPRPIEAQGPRAIVALRPQRKSHHDHHHTHPTNDANDE